MSIIAEESIKRLVNLCALSLVKLTHPFFKAKSGDKPYFLAKEENSHNSENIEDLHRQIADLGLVNNQRVLDIGAGDGRWTIPLALESKYMYAVEPDNERRKLLVKRIEEAKDKKICSIEVQDGVAEKLSFMDNYFDLVFCCHVFPYLNQEPALREMTRVLKPGGKICVTSNGLGYFLMQIKLGIRFGLTDKALYGLNSICSTLTSRLLKRNFPGQKYSSIPRLVRILKRHGCQVVLAKPWLRHPFFPLKQFGAVTNFLVIGVKEK